MSAALAFAGASAGLNILGGLFGYLAAEDAASISESRGRLLLIEADADAERYAEQARGFKASQKLAFLKSGVTLEGSPLDILDETARVTSENLSAMRARATAQGLEADAQASALRDQGRAALIGGVAGAASSFASAAYKSGRNAPPPESGGGPGFSTGTGADRKGYRTPARMP